MARTASQRRFDKRAFELGVFRSSQPVMFALVWERYVQGWFDEARNRSRAQGIGGIQQCFLHIFDAPAQARSLMPPREQTNMEWDTAMNTHTDSRKDSRMNACDRARNAGAILKQLAAALLVLDIASGCATRGPPADECGFADAAIPAAIEGVVVGAITGRATHNRDAGVAAGGALGVADYQRRQDACQRAVEYRRMMAEQRAQAEWIQRQREAEERQRDARQAESEWAQNNRCVTRTVDDFGRRVEDRRDCTHVEYGRRYWPGQ